MKEEEVHARIKELLGEIAKLPENQRKTLEPIARETQQRHEEIKETADKVEKSFTDLRICLKYLMFDLEATRRERDAIRRLYEDKSDNENGRMD